MLSPRPVQVAAALGLALAASACTTHVEQMPAGAERVRATRASAGSAWILRSAGEERGSVVLYQEPGPEGRGIYAVRNRHGQDLGFVDQLGRAWKRRVHAREPELMGTGSLLQGALRILNRTEDKDGQLLQVSQLSTAAGSSESLNLQGRSPR